MVVLSRNWSSGSYCAWIRAGAWDFVGTRDRQV
jgi:hypothetical protein